MMHDVFIGFGSNQGESVLICREAIAALGEYPGVAIRAVSSFYRTEPVGFENQPWFVNGVVECATELEPDDLLPVVQQIEHRFGRVRQVRWGPRTLDLDILTFGDRVVNRPDLIIPHPRLHERRFVLAPLKEISPGWQHPVLRASADALLRKLEPHTGGRVLRLELP